MNALSKFRILSETNSSQWVSVDERLPKEKYALVAVVAVDENGAMMVDIRTPGVCDVDCGKYKVMYWLQLPEIPKKAQELMMKFEKDGRIQEEDVDG